MINGDTLTCSTDIRSFIRQREWILLQHLQREHLDLVKDERLVLDKKKNRQRGTKMVSIVYMKNMSFRFIPRLLFCTAVPRSSSQNQEVLNRPLRRWMDKAMWLMLRALSRTQFYCTDFAPLNRGLFCSSSHLREAAGLDLQILRKLGFCLNRMGLAQLLGGINVTTNHIMI